MTHPAVQGRAGAFALASATFFLCAAADAAQEPPAPPKGTATPLGKAYRLDAGPMSWGPLASPDGKRVAYFTITRSDPRRSSQLRNRLTVSTSDGSSAWVAIDSIDNKSETSPIVPRLVWTADSSAVYCVNNDDPWGKGAVRIWKVDVSKQSVTDLGPFAKEWRYYLTRAALGPDGVSLVLGSSDHRLWQVDKGHSAPLTIVSPKGEETATRATYKDALSSPLGTTTLAICPYRNELHRLDLGGQATKIHAYPEEFVARLSFAGETGEALMMTGSLRDRRAWNVAAPLFTPTLVTPEGKSASLGLKTSADGVVALPEKDTVLVVGVEDPHVFHPFRRERQDLTIPGPAFADPSPSANNPVVLLRIATEADKADVRFLNWKTGKVDRLTEEPFDRIRFPVSWSADGSALAFTRAVGDTRLTVPGLVTPHREGWLGEIWLLRLAKEE